MTCVLVRDKEKLPFNIYPISLYLHEKIKTSSMYYFNKTNNNVIIRFDKIEHGDFFVSKETTNF